MMIPRVGWNQQYRPDRFGDRRYYHPSQHGAEKEIRQQMMRRRDDNPESEAG